MYMLKKESGNILNKLLTTNSLWGDRIEWT